VTVAADNLLRSCDRRDPCKGIVGLYQKDLQYGPANTGRSGGFVNGRKSLHWSGMLDVGTAHRAMEIDRPTFVDGKHRDPVVPAPVKHDIRRRVHASLTMRRLNNHAVTNRGWLVTVVGAMVSTPHGLVCISGHGQVVAHDGEHDEETDKRAAHCPEPKP